MSTGATGNSGSTPGQSRRQRPFHGAAALSQSGAGRGAPVAQSSSTTASAATTTGAASTTARAPSSLFMSPPASLPFMPSNNTIGGSATSASNFNNSPGSGGNGSGGGNGVLGGVPASFTSIPQHARRGSLPTASPSMPRRGSLSGNPAPAFDGPTPLRTIPTQGRRGSIAKYSPNVVSVPLNVADMSAVYNAAVAARSASAGNGLDKSAFEKPMLQKSPAPSSFLASMNAIVRFEPEPKTDGFDNQIGKWTLAFRDPVTELSYLREWSDIVIRSWQLFVSIAAVVGVAFSALRDMQVSGSAPADSSNSDAAGSTYLRLGSPLVVLGCHLTLLTISFSVTEATRALWLNWLTTAVLMLHVLGGVIVYDMVLLVEGIPTGFGSISYSIYRPGFLFVVSAMATILLLRLRFTFAAVSSAVLWLIFMVVGAHQYPWPTHPLLDYIFVGGLTFVSLGTSIAFVYQIERRSRLDFYRSQFYAQSCSKLQTQLLAIQSSPHTSSALPVDLISPLERAAALLRELLAQPKLEGPLVTALATVLRLIQSSNPMIPDFQSSLLRATAGSGGGGALSNGGNSNAVSQNLSGLQTGGGSTQGVSSGILPTVRQSSADLDQEKWVQNEVLPRASQLLLHYSPVRTISEPHGGGGRASRGSPLSRFQFSATMPPPQSAAGSMSVYISLTNGLEEGEGPPKQKSVEASKMGQLSSAASTSGATQRTSPDALGDGSVTSTDIVAELDAVTGAVSILRFGARVIDYAKLGMFFDSSLEWNWQIFDFETATFGAPLLVFSSAIFWREKLFESMHIPIDKFLRCMHRIETGYRATISYHNSTHATDVLHGAYVFSHCEILQNNLSDLERVALYFAASIHDHQHPGVSNVFLIAKQDPLAVLYSDRSVLEQHHLASAFAVLNSPECNFTADWDPATRKSFRDLVIELVLATDLKLQAELMTVWKTRVECFDVRLSTDRTMMLKLIMKASDVANPSKELPIYREWIERIMQEFFEQGDEERRLGLPISPYCDSAQPNLPGSQVGFMTWIVLPLYEAIHQVMPLPVQIGQLRSSFEYWKATQAAAQATAAAAAAVVSPSQIPEEGKQPKEKPNKFDEPLSPVIVRSNKNYSSDSNDSEDDAAVQSSSTTGVTQALLPDRIPSLTQGPGR